MKEALIWTALAAIGGIGVLLLAVLKWVASLARQLTLAETAAQRADAATTILSKDVYDHHVETARRVAEIGAKADNAAQAIIAAETRMAKAMDEFGERLDRIVDRLDRVLERRDFDAGR